MARQGQDLSKRREAMFNIAAAVGPCNKRVVPCQYYDAVQHNLYPYLAPAA